MAEQDAYQGSEGWDDVREATSEWLEAGAPCMHGVLLKDRCPECLPDSTPQEGDAPRTQQLSTEQYEEES